MITTPVLALGDAVTVGVDGLEELIALLRQHGYRTIGPTVRDGAISLREIDSVSDFPRGWHDVQAPGSYRISNDGDAELFGWAVGPQSVKAEVFPPTATVFKARTADDGKLIFEAPSDAGGGQPLALFAARPCEIAALAVLDRVLAAAPGADPTYAARRNGTFLVTAECGKPAGTCFCLSMGTGPDAGERFDIALTEILEGEHRFVLRIGSDRAATLVAAITHRQADESDLGARDRILGKARASMGREMDATTVPLLLARNIGNPHWADVAERCLACGNCTMVCPTCFCSDIEDASDLDGNLSRTRTWASCFDLGHSYMHGGPVRVSVKSRYRQWITHKLSTWHDQFGTSGCVGCGRCITWCPVGIDITAEVRAIQASEQPERQVPDATA